MNFRNPVDINILLEADQLALEEINKLISAGVKLIGFSNLQQLGEIEQDLLPCKKYFLGDLEGNNISPILANFDLIESIVDIGQVKMISDLNARLGKITNIMVRMNVVSEIKKFGFGPAEISEECYEIAKTSGIRLIGLNSYVPPVENEKIRKVAIRKAGTMYKLLDARFRGFDRFSMNFISQFEDLIAEGVNEIRIGIKNLA